MIVWIALLRSIKKKKNNFLLQRKIYENESLFNVHRASFELRYILLKAIQRGIRMIHLILFHDRICGEHTVADSDIQMTSGLHPLWTRCLALKCFLTPFDTFACLPID